MYDEAKAIDPKLPVWNKVQHLEAEAKPKPSGMRELRRDGSVADSELEARGFAVGCKVVKKGDAEIFSITALGKAISLQPEAEAAKGDTTRDIDRLEFLSNWTLHVVEEVEVFQFGEYPSPSLFSDMLSDVWKGTIKSALMVAFKKSSEPHIVIHKSPALKVKVKKHFKEGDFSIVGLTNHIAISHSKSNDLLLAECYNHPSFGPMKAYAKSHLQFPTKQKATGFARQQVEPFIVAYWACQESYDPAKANSEAKLVTTSIKIGGRATRSASRRSLTPKP